METFGKVVVLLILGFVAALVKGFVLSTMWGWFIVPTFGLPAISLLVSVGVIYIITVFTYQPYTGVDAKETPITFVVNHGIMTPLFLLFFGWIVHLFM
jgi:hypothetical protein